MDNAERLSLIVPGEAEPIAPTNWSFGQLSSLVGAPASYLRGLPAALAGINLQHGLLSHRGEQVKLLKTNAGRSELRARSEARRVGKGCDSTCRSRWVPYH